MSASRKIVAVVAAVVAVTGARPSPASAQATPEMAAHIDSARTLSGTDVSPAIMKVLCADPKEVSAFLLPIMMKSTTMPATRSFDDLYYLGTDFVGSWALNTSDGIILFDALDNTQEAKDIIETGLRSVGLDPAQIKYIVVMHGHGDHYGGAKYMQDKYHAKVFMSAADWDFAPKWLGDFTKAGTESDAMLCLSRDCDSDGHAGFDRLASGRKPV